MHIKTNRFSKHCSNVDERGYILFYKSLKPALVDAGVTIAAHQSQTGKIHEFLAQVAVLNAKNINIKTGGTVQILLSLKKVELVKRLYHLLRMATVQHIF